MNNALKILAAIALATLVGYAFGRYVQPAKVQIQTKEVVKQVETVKHDTVTVTQVITKPDGSKETETTVTDKDVDQVQTIDQKESTKLTVNIKPQWKVSGMAGIKDLSGRPIYGAIVERRIIGPVFVGAWGNTNSTVGLSVGLEF